MFFPDRIKNIAPSDRVLEIGPGSDPFPRSDVLLEKKYQTQEEYKAQLGYTQGLNTTKPIVFYDGDIFPFKDKEFDYVICSHVLEHISDVKSFIGEINRVGKKGYIEFPTIYYDFIYDFPVHVTFLLNSNDFIYWMPKDESQLKTFKNVTSFFYKSLQKKHYGLTNELMEYFFQGFEWIDEIKEKRANSIAEVCFNDNIDIPVKKGTPPESLLKIIQRRVKNKFMNILKNK